MVEPMAKRRVVGFLMTEHGFGEQRAAGSLASLGRRSSISHAKRRRGSDQADENEEKLELIQWINFPTNASENRRYGYQRLHVMLRRAGLVMNHKRTYWL